MSDLIASRLLDSVITTLERVVVPELSREESRTALDLVIRVLGMLSARFSKREAALQELLGRLADILGTDETKLEAPTYAQSALQQLEVARDRLEAQLAQRVPALIDRAGNDGDAPAIALLQAVIDSERDFLSQQDPDILTGSAVVYRGGRIAREARVGGTHAPRREIDQDGLTIYLRQRFPERPRISASDVRIISGGFSKTTVLFQFGEPGGVQERVALRKDLPVLLMDKTVRNEYPLLEKMHAAGVRVAPPCWLEEDVGIFGGSFFVSNAIAGTANVQQWAGSPQAVTAVTRDLAQITARLHTLDLSGLGYAPEIAYQSAGTAMLAEIAWWENLYHRRRQRHYPLMEIPLAWLKANVPAYLFDIPARVVHGDVGFHNLMVEEDRVSGLLDWEFWHFGDPAEDLAYLRPFMQQIGAWDDFLRQYRDNGGAAYSVEAERFYRVWSLTRNPIGTLDAQWIFDNHLPDEIKLAVASYIFSPYLELDGCNLVMDLINQRQ